jgi:hypothetical protein
VHGDRIFAALTGAQLVGNKCRFNGDKVDVNLLCLLDDQRRADAIKHLMQIGVINTGSENPYSRYPPECTILCPDMWKIYLELGTVPAFHAHQLVYLWQVQSPVHEHLRLKIFDMCLDGTPPRSSHGAPLRLAVKYGAECDCGPSQRSDLLQAIANKYGGDFREVDLPPPPCTGTTSNRYYWARGNAKRAYLRVLCALRCCGICLYADLRRLLYHLIVGPIDAGRDHTTAPWADGKWRYERETWREDREALLARIVSKLQTLNYKHLRALASGHIFPY